MKLKFLQTRSSHRHTGRSSCGCHTACIFVKERRRRRRLGKYEAPRHDREKRSGEGTEGDEPSSQSCQTEIGFVSENDRIDIRAWWNTKRTMLVLSMISTPLILDQLDDDDDIGDDYFVRDAARQCGQTYSVHS